MQETNPASEASPGTAPGELTAFPELPKNPSLKIAKFATVSQLIINHKTKQSFAKVFY